MGFTIYTQAAQVNVFVHTNFFNQRQPQYAGSTTRVLPFPSAFTPDLMAVALACLHDIYRTGYQYKKAGVYLTHITSREVLLADLFGLFSLEQHDRQQ